MDALNLANKQTMETTVTATALYPYELTDSCVMNKSADYSNDLRFKLLSHTQPNTHHHHHQHHRQQVCKAINAKIAVIKLFALLIIGPNLCDAYRNLHDITS